MADYNLEIVGLVQPPQPAYLQAYRPTLAVLNTGKKPLTLSGLFSVYERQAPGRLIFQSGLIAATVAAGDTAQLLGALFWTPAAAGDYTIAAHVGSNRPGLFRDLGPLALYVSPDEPPEPPIVTAHATQHETGGVDPINVTALRGELYDPQPPKDHASRHEQGGADEMSVTGLAGQLLEPQPTAPHANEKHTTLFVDAPALTSAISGHNAAGTAHASATNLEQTNKKGAANGYAELDANVKVPADQLGGEPISLGQFLRADQHWATIPLAEAQVDSRDDILTAPADEWTNIALLSLSGGQLSAGARLDFSALGDMDLTIPGGLAIKVQHSYNGVDWTNILDDGLSLPGDHNHFSLNTYAVIIDPAIPKYYSWASIVGCTYPAFVPVICFTAGGWAGINPTLAHHVRVLVRPATEPLVLTGVNFRISALTGNAL